MSGSSDQGKKNSLPVTVLLVDDQPIVGEAVRRMLASERDIVFHFCSDPARAIDTANTVQPTVILQDLVMPGIDGLTLVKFFRANPGTRQVPMIVLSTKEEPVIKAQAFALGANDYLVKLPDSIELIARIRYHSRSYLNQLERDEAYRRLAESERLMVEELAQASRYVQSLLPPPLTGDVSAQWRFVPSTQLGGDIFSYYWLDSDHLAARRCWRFRRRTCYPRKRCRISTFAIRESSFRVSTMFFRWRNRTASISPSGTAFIAKKTASWLTATPLIPHRCFGPARR
jgi:CheY-like chemotaxis protein